MARAPVHRFCANSASAAMMAMVLAPSFCAGLEEGPAPGERARAPGRVVEPLVVLDLRVDVEGEVAHQQQVALLDERHDRRGHVGAVGRDQQVDLVDVEQLGVDAGDQARVGLVVVGDELHLAPEQPALGVDVLHPHLQRDQRRLAAAAERAGLRHAHADLDGLLRDSSEGNRERAERGGQQFAEFHRLPPQGESGHYSKKWP